MYPTDCCVFVPRRGPTRQFEDAIRKQREHIGNWMKYTTWEESQMEFERARSVYERALEVDYRNQVGQVVRPVASGCRGRCCSAVAVAKIMFCRCRV